MRKATTLLELLMVLVVIGLLLLLARPALAGLIDRAAVMSATSEVVAVIGKTEGNGGVNDFTRILADQAFRRVLARRGRRSEAEIATIPMVWSGGCDGVITPHATVFARNAKSGSPTQARLAIGTEGHFVRNAREQAALRGVEVVNLADVPGGATLGCGCATMSRNDPPHLVALLDLLRRGTPPDLNRVLPGDVVNESTGERDRLPPAQRDALARDARRALERMIEITEAAG